MEKQIANDVAAVNRLSSVQKILEIVCRTTGMGFSAVARVTDSRWVACAVRDEISFGLAPGGELPLETTICNEIRQHQSPVVIDDVANDKAFCGHPTPTRYGFQSYASFPVHLPGGDFFGTLCAIDPRPARLNTPEIRSMFKHFADLIGMQLESQQRVAASEAALLDERQTAQLREQFIAVLGHDLRNPLNAINSGAQLLGLSDLSADDMETLGMIQRSAARMSALINDVLDLARGRLGGGVTLQPLVENNLQAVLAHVLAELQSAFPARKIEVDFDLARPVVCDAGRISQMLSNLVANAITHGQADSPVWVRIRSDANQFEITVRNLGPTIAPDVLTQLFQPFVRGNVRKTQQGLGLGLYIASEIARAHSGVLEVQSVANETVFTFTMRVKTKAN